MILKDIAYVRSGDKGDKSNIGILAFDKKSYDFLQGYLTPELIKAHFGERVKGEVKVFPLPNLRAFNVLMDEALGGGATKTLRHDQTGKAMGNALYRLKIEGFSNE